MDFNSFLTAGNFLSKEELFMEGKESVQDWLRVTKGLDYVNYVAEFEGHVANPTSDV